MTIQTSDFSTASYAANNIEKTSHAVCVTDATKTYDVRWKSYQIYQNTSVMQWQKSNGYLYNITSIGSITNVTITSTQGTFTTYYGDAEQPSGSTTTGGSFFKICIGTDELGKTSKIEITFEINEVPKVNHNATFSVNGENLTSIEVEEGATITFPTDPADVSGKVFWGWTTTAIDGTTDTEPTKVTSATMGQSDVTYYAVFADKTDAQEEELSMSILPSTSGIPSEYASATDCNLNGVVFNITQMYKSGEKMQWRAQGNKNGTGCMFNKGVINKIQSIVLTYDESDSNKNFTVHVGNSVNPTNGTSVTSTTVNSISIFDCSSYNANYFVLTNGSGAGYLTSIVIKYLGVGSDTYSGFCTTVAADTRAEASIKFEEESKTVLNPGGIGQALTNPNNLTISYTSSDENVATISNDGTVNLLAAGQTIITATFAGNDEYKPATVSYTLNVMENASISVEDTQIAFGNSYTINAAQIKGGDITVTSNNTAVATVNGLTITPVAVGETTIIVSTAENNLYNAGSKSFKLTVTMPEGLITAAINEVFNETFSQCTGTGGHTDGGNFDNGSQNGSVEGETDESWSTITTIYPANGCGRIGSGSNSGTLSTTINLRGNATLTFSAAGWKGNDTNTIAVTADGATLSGDTNITLTNAEWHNYTVNITGVTDEVTLTFTGKRGFLDDIKVSEPATINVTLNAVGYATYCSLYPLDFTHAEGYTAWQITSISSDNVITFEKVTGSVKGGTGLLLKGEAGATVTLTSADSQTALNDNLLFGTLAPTYISAGEYYGLSGKTFVKVNAGTVPAGKALLPANLVNESTGGNVKAFTFVFNDLTTGVNAVDNGQWTMDNGAIFDLSGRRLSKPAKGINIINGKKVVVK